MSSNPERHTVIALLTIAIVSIAVHEVGSQVRAVQSRAALQGATVAAPVEVRVVRVQRSALAQVLTHQHLAHDILGLESRVIDAERNQLLDVERRLAPLASGTESEVVLSLRSRGRPLSVVVIAADATEG